MLTTNIIVRELSKLSEKEFSKFLKETIKDIKVKQHIFEQQEYFSTHIEDYHTLLTPTEKNMLHTLNNYCLLLSIGYETDFLNRKILVAYNLERKIVLRKILEA